jgi:glutamate dehydrogenase
LSEDLEKYFPRPLRKDYAAAIARHRLRREIIATSVTNSMINRAGIVFVNDMRERTNATSSDITRAYTVARQVFGLRKLWTDIEALDNKVPAPTQYWMLATTMQLLERATLWLLRNGGGPIDIAAFIRRFEPGATALLKAMPTVLDATHVDESAKLAATLVAEGVPKTLADAVSYLDDMIAALDIVRIAEAVKSDVPAVARLYFAVGARLGLDWLRAAAGKIKIETPWQKRAVEAVYDDLSLQQGEIARRAVNGGGAADAAMATWLEGNQANLARIDGLMTELKAASLVDLAALTVAGRELRALTS